MKKDEFLKIVSKEIHFFLDREKISKELENHLEDSILDLMEEGFSKEEAEIQAVLQMGNAKEIGKQLNREHHPILGWLWLLSNVAVMICAIPMITIFLSFVAGTWDMLTPTVVDQCANKVAIDMKVETPTHHIYLDYFCEKEDGRVFITYRAVTQLDYSRAGWSFNAFTIETKDGEWNQGSGTSSGSFFGQIGCVEIHDTSEKELVLRFPDGKSIELDLEEYGL